MLAHLLGPAVLRRSAALYAVAVSRWVSSTAETGSTPAARRVAVTTWTLGISAQVSQSTAGRGSGQARA